MSAYLDLIEEKRKIISAKQEWSAINAEYAVRMDLQNRFKTGLEIAQYTADIVRRDMANLRCGLQQVHPVPRLLAWLCCATSHDEREETPTDHRSQLHLLVWLDGCSTALAVRPTARPKHA